MQKIQGPGTIIKFWGIAWLGKTHVFLDVVAGKIQVRPTRKKAEEIPAFVGIVGFLRAYFLRHSAVVPYAAW